MESVRKIIREVLGTYIPINDMANRYAKKVMDVILKQSENGTIPLNPLNEGLTVREYTSKEDVEDCKIGYIAIDIFPKADEVKMRVNKVTGDYDAISSTPFKKNGEILFSTFLKIYVIDWDGQTSLIPQIQEVLTHELIHAFRDIQKLKNDVLNQTKNEMKWTYELKNKELQKFMEIFYLSTPEEVVARVHEAYKQMENLKLNFKNDSSDEVLKKLSGLGVFKDFLKIQNFQLQSLLNLPNEEKANFVNKFNEILKKNGYKKIINNPDEFFTYWLSKAKTEGLKARHKIVSQALNLFSGKTISEFKNKNYGEQFMKEVSQNLEPMTLRIIYENVDNGYSPDYDDILINELRVCSNFEG